MEILGIWPLGVRDAWSIATTFGFGDGVGASRGYGETGGCFRSGYEYVTIKGCVSGERFKWLPSGGDACGGAGSECRRDPGRNKNSFIVGAGNLDEERARRRSRVRPDHFSLCGERSHSGAGGDLHPGKDFPRAARRSVEDPGRTSAALYVDDLSQRLHRDV